MLHFQTLARKLKENRHGSTSVPEKVIGHIQEQEEGERDNILQGCGHALPHIVLANQGQIDKCKDRVQHSAHNGGRVEPVHAWLSLGHQDFLSLMDEIFLEFKPGLGQLQRNPMPYPIQPEVIPKK